MALPVCVNCEHSNPHNLWGRCAVEGCTCRDFELSLETYNPTDDSVTTASEVTVMRDPSTEAPIAIPAEIVAEADRVYKAYQDNLEGKTWTAIYLEARGTANAWESPQAIAATVQSYLDRGRIVWGDFTANEMLAVKIAQLDLLLSKIMGKAMSGTMTAVSEARQIITKQIVLAGWAAPAREDANTGRPTALVGMVRDGEGNYVADLKLVVDNTETDAETQAG